MIIIHGANAVPDAWRRGLSLDRGAPVERSDHPRRIASA